MARVYTVSIPAGDSRVPAGFTDGTAYRTRKRADERRAELRQAFAGDLVVPNVKVTTFEVEP